MRTVTYKSVLDRVAGYLQQFDGLSVEDAGLANAKINFLVRLAWEYFWWPELMGMREVTLEPGLRRLALEADTRKHKGRVTLSNGAVNGSVSGLDLEFTPGAVLLQIQRPAGGLNLRPMLVQETLDADGFSYELDGVTDSDAYELIWEVLPPGEADTERGEPPDYAGSKVLGNGVQSGSVSGLGLSFTPESVHCQVARPSGLLNLSAYPDMASVSADGFRFELDGVTDAAEAYEVHYVLGGAWGQQRGVAKLRRNRSGERLRGLGLNEEGSAARAWARCQVCRPSGGLNLGAWPASNGFDADGFRYELGGLPDNDDYTVCWRAGGETRPLGEIKAIWDRDPRRNRYACRVGGGRGPDYRLRTEGAYVLGTANPVWVEYRSRPNVYTGPVRSASGTYAAGATVYDTDTGDYWTARESVSAGESPVSVPAKWGKVEFPYVLSEFVALSAYRMLTQREESGQEDFRVSAAEGWPLLQAELAKIERLQGQTRQLRVAR